MPDHFHSGDITTLHRLPYADAGRLELQLEQVARQENMALVLPCHARDIGGPAFALITSVLCEIRYLGEIVISLDAAGAEDEVLVRSLTRNIPARVHVLRRPQGGGGKGANLHSCLRFLAHNSDASIVAIHDCDILTYDRELLARLLFPVASPDLGFRFAKGYYARFSDCLHGRLSRLFLFPLLRALSSVAPASRTLHFLQSLRYPLAGECAMDMKLARNLEFPTGWGVEIGMLDAIRLAVPPSQVCQVELCARYDHKHQPLESGLAHAARETALAVLHALNAEGIKPVPAPVLTALQKCMHQALRQSAADASINGLTWDGDEETAATSLFFSIFENVLAEDFPRSAHG